MAIITLTTDFGYKDHFVAAIKGTILREVPDARIVDISHGISPFHLQECAYILKNAYPSFPEGSIHIIGLDSELSPENEHLVALIDSHYFIGSNNGVISMLAAGTVPERIAKIDIPNPVNGAFPTFDVLVVVACHLARGGKLEVVSKPYSELRELRDFEPRVTNDGKTIIGNVIYIDNYGNVVTNIQKTLFEAYRNGRAFEISARTEKVRHIHHTYNGFINYELPPDKRKGPGDLLALFNSSGYIELAIYKSDQHSVGSASSLLGLEYRDTITINFT